MITHQNKQICQRLLERARLKHGDISPCRNWESFEECYTIFRDRVIFWFNSSDGSTHAISEEIQEENN